MTVLKDWLDKVQNQAPVDVDALKESVRARLKAIYDPEIPVNIYDLGLIYRLDVDEQGVVDIDMTLTSPACPVAQERSPLVHRVYHHLRRANPQPRLPWFR